ncbi:MAG TPA: ribonuclease HII [Blastocatellia bacterium]|nr:ribonuclease HII [Blastocatellia bacterium]
MRRRQDFGSALCCDTKFEEQLLVDGTKLIAGTDEVGRGAMAGPVVAAAVILDLADVPEGINDSKRLTRLRRERLAEELMRRAVAFAVTRIEADEIDRINIHHASLKAMGLAVKVLRPQPDYVLIDGRHTVPHLACPQSAIVKGDSLSVSIAAASILAKVARDRWMAEYDMQYPGYGFATHAGYCTRFHREAVARLGPSAIHRQTFHGVSTYQPALDLSGEM